MSFGAALAELKKGDLWGERLEKYEALKELSLMNPVFFLLETQAPQHYLST